MATVNGSYVPLCGDVILQARFLIPDTPNTLGSVPATIGVVAAAGSTLPTGTYAAVVTQLNYWGECLAQGETTGLNVSLNEGIQIQSALLPGAVKIRCYLTLPGGSPGSECQFIESTVSPFTISTPLPLPGNPPTRNTAWNPDTDGQFASCATLYNWLNAGLQIISRGTGGLLDYAGVGSSVGQPLYNVPGQWIELTSVWYDGYWVLGGDRAQFFRRNTITSSVLSSCSMSVVGGQNVLEVFPQPARTAAFTVLATPMAATDTMALLVDTSGFLLPFGFVQIDNEIMAYATISGNQLTGLIRGLGGSLAVAHLPGAPSQELNIFWSGKRQIAPTYQQGNATTALAIPNGWDQLLIQYVAGRAKLVEHDTQSFQVFNQEMEKAVKGWALSNAGVARRRQVGGAIGPVVYYPTPGGGLITP